MSNFIVRDTAALFDPATGQWVGVIDGNGQEHIIVPPGAKALSASTSSSGGIGSLVLPNGYARLPDRLGSLHSARRFTGHSGAQSANQGRTWETIFAFPFDVIAIQVIFHNWQTYDLTNMKLSVVAKSSKTAAVGSLIPVTVGGRHVIYRQGPYRRRIWHLPSRGRRAHCYRHHPHRNRGSQRRRKCKADRAPYVLRRCEYQPASNFKVRLCDPVGYVPDVPALRHGRPDGRRERGLRNVGQLPGASNLHRCLHA